MCCSVVFGIMMRLLVINILSSSLAIKPAAYYQRCVTTCGAVAMVHRQPCWQHLACYCSVNSKQKPDIGSESRFLPISPAFNAPIRGEGSRLNFAMSFGEEKLEWCGYPTVKKFWWYVYSFWQNSWTWHTHTQTPHDNIGRPCIASCGRNLFVTCLLHLVSISVQFSWTVLNLASYTLSFLIICVFRNSLPQVMFCVITE